MISDWLSEDGRKATDKMGEPGLVVEGPVGTENKVNELALALLRDRARAWLVEQHGRVECELFADGVSRVRVGPAESRREYLGHNFDRALIQAIMATERSET